MDKKSISNTYSLLGVNIYASFLSEKATDAIWA